MLTREQVLETLRQHKPELMRKYPIKSLALFGSFARNEQTEESDVDVMVELNGRMGFRFGNLAIDLEDILQHKVDLVTPNGIGERMMPFVAPDLIEL